MTAIRYNPITYLDKLIKSGMGEETARIIANREAEQTSAINVELLATKEDINKIVNKLELVIAKIEALENRMTIKFGTIMLIGVGLLNFIMKHN